MGIRTRIGVIIATVASLGAVLWLMDFTKSRHSAAIEVDERVGAYSAPIRILARIQSDMERIAAGQPRWPLPQGIERDPLEQLTDALAAYLAGDHARFIAALHAVTIEARARLAANTKTVKAQRYNHDENAVILPDAYGERLSQFHLGDLGDLATAMRKVDATLVLERSSQAYHEPRYDLIARRDIREFTAAEKFVDSTWLRLPCRSAVGRGDQLTQIANAMGELAGPLTSCPLQMDGAANYAAHQALANNPASAQPYAPAPAAIVFDDFPQMGKGLDAVEEELAALATTPLGKLDYALFLHALRPAQQKRAETIRQFMAEIDVLSNEKAEDWQKGAAGPLIPYDGSDSSLAPSLRLAVYSQVAAVRNGDYRYAYVIPCPIDQARPDLLRLGNTPVDPGPDGEWFVGLPAPVSGCVIGRPEIPGFPTAPVAAYVNATEAADGAAWTNHSKRPRFPLQHMDLEVMADLLYRPEAFLQAPPSAITRVYETWGYMNLSNQDIAQRLEGLFGIAHHALAGALTGRGFNPDTAATIATRALYAMSFGYNCGDAPPSVSVRKMVMDGATAADIVAFIQKTPRTSQDMAAFAACGKWAPMDSILMVSVKHPEAMKALLALSPRLAPNDPEGLDKLEWVNIRNHFGKTALMIAAQFDQPKSIRILLEHGARINATTWDQGDYQTLSHDSRTALMYAAAEGSAETIRLLMKAGADPFQTDSKGHRAVEYLLGFGPVPANSKLSVEERSQMIRLLF